jgi:CBS domain-containing protein
MNAVRDVMTTTVWTVQADAPLKEVAQLLVDRRISGVPVVDGDGNVVGIVSEADFLVKPQGSEGVHHRHLARFVGESRAARAALAKLAAVTAGEAMTAPAITIGPGRPVGEAAAVMTSRGVNRLPVVDGTTLVGIVTRADIVRAYVRSDQDLARTIREDVLRRTLSLDPAGFTVTVKDGVAWVVGSVDRRPMADVVEWAIRTTPGVVDLHIDMSWPVDPGPVEPTSFDPDVREMDGGDP